MDTFESIMRENLTVGDLTNLGWYLERLSGNPDAWVYDVQGAHPSQTWPADTHSRHVDSLQDSDPGDCTQESLKFYHHPFTGEYMTEADWLAYVERVVADAHYIDGFEPADDDT